MSRLGLAARGAEPADIWETIALEATQESTVWADALRDPSVREHLSVFSPLADDVFALGLETIYEGYLLHYGRPRLFEAPDRDTGVLLGDYLYAHGLVRIADLGRVAVVADLAELLSLCAHVRAESAASRPLPDGAVWAATVVLLGDEEGRLERARSALRERGDASELAAIAEEAGRERAERALTLHGDRVALG